MRVAEADRVNRLDGGRGEWSEIQLLTLKLSETGLAFFFFSLIFIY